MKTETITLLGGAVVTVQPDNVSHCKMCGAEILFAKTKNGKVMPIIKNGDHWQSHFTDCQYAKYFRK